MLDNVHLGLINLLLLWAHTCGPTDRPPATDGRPAYTWVVDGRQCMTSRRNVFFVITMHTFPDSLEISNLVSH